MKSLMIAAMLLATLQPVHAEMTPNEWALRHAKTPLQQACIRWGGKDLFRCESMAKKCGKPDVDIAKWAVANCGAAAFINCWQKNGLRGNKLEICVDDYMDKHPPEQTSDRTLSDEQHRHRPDQ